MPPWTTTAQRSQKTVSPRVVCDYFVLLAAMNPCPCGYYGDPVKECTCINGVFPAWFLADFDRHIRAAQSLKRLKREIDVERWSVGLDYGDITLLQVAAPELAELEGSDFAAIARRLRMSLFDA